MKGNENSGVLLSIRPAPEETRTAHHVAQPFMIEAAQARRRRRERDATCVQRRSAVRMHAMFEKRAK